MKLDVVILAAGMGTRLGRPLPKPLTELADGRSIMQQQIDNLDAVFADDYRLMIVVGFKMDVIMERFPQALFVYNEIYDQTNTGKSLLKALSLSGDGGVLWLNGDVVFDAEVLQRMRGEIAANNSTIAVNTARVAAEEVKYTLDDQGYIVELSKTVENGLGEAVGINFVSSLEKAALIEKLAQISEKDYFERGIELAIAAGEMKCRPMDISDLRAIEVDFAEDLERANTIF